MMTFRSTLMVGLTAARLRGAMLAIPMVAIGVLAVGCGSNADPVAKATVDGWYNELVRKVAKIQPQKKRAAVAHGQYARYLELNDENQPAQVTFKVVGEDGAMVLEIVRFDYLGQSVFQLGVAGPWDAGELPRVSSVKVQRNGGPIETVPVDEASGLLNRLVGAMSQKTTDDQPQNQKVAAGEFVGARKAVGPLSWGDEERHSETWMHGSVPVTGWVKSQTKDGTFKRELTEYGLEGAKSSIREVTP